MKRVLLAGLFSGALVCATACMSSKKQSTEQKAANDSVSAPGASSEIPARREFPVNPNVKPCDDFYAYACSKVDSSFKLREDRSHHTFSFNDSYERLLEAKKEFLKNLEKDTGLSKRGRDLRNVYLACMNVEASKSEEKEIVGATVKKVRDLQTNKAVQEYFASRMATEDYSPLDFGRLGNHDNADWDDIYLVADFMSLPERSYYDKSDVYGDFESLLKEFFTTIGSDNPAERAKAVAAFEKEFAQSYPLPAEFRELVSTKTGISRQDLTANYPNFHLQGFLSKIPDRTHIRHLTPANFEWMNKAFNEKPVSVLQDVYLYHAIKDYMDDAYPDFFQKRFAFANKHLGGPPVRPPRDERCAKQVMGSFTKELDSEMWRRLFPNFPRERFVKLAENVRKSIIDGLKANAWLNEKTREAAAEKIKKAKLQLVAPRTDEEWDFNPPATYSPKTPYSNMRRLGKNLNSKAIRELSKPRNKVRWGMGPLTINAYYSSTDNKFVMPVGILQYPFFDSKLSDEANLGAVGAVIGHELGHGIDDKGSRYDANGRLHNWFTPEDLGEFNRRGQKLISQFNSAGHNGTLTLGENIGDFVGLTFAYRTAFPNGKGTPEQRQAFFTQYARVWCHVTRPKYRDLLLKTDSHSLGEARVNEQMKHQKGFKEAFQCAEGDKMVYNDDQRVEIW